MRDEERYSKNYDPQKAHEYYMKHRKLKGRKKKGSTVKTLNKKARHKASSSKKKKGKKASATATMKSILNTLNEQGAREAEIQKQKVANEKKEFMKSLNKKWKDKIKELEQKAKSATDEELDKIKTEIATAQVDCKAEKDLVTKYYNNVYLGKLTEISKDKNMRK